VLMNQKGPDKDPTLIRHTHNRHQHGIIIGLHRTAANQIGAHA